MCGKEIIMTFFPNSGNIPKLRFSEFAGEWEERYISEVISSKSKKYNPENSDSNYPSIELESLSQDSGELLSTFDSKNQKSIKNVFNSGDVLFGKLRPYLKKYYLADFDGVCSSEIWVLKSSILDSNYLYAFVQSNSFISLTEISSGSKMPRADWNLVSSSLIVYPSNTNERKKIGKIIKLINSRIQTQRKIIEKLETLMKVSRINIFSQKLRFKNEQGYDFPDWKKLKLGKIGNFQTSSIDKLSKENENEVYLVNYMNVYRHEDINSSTIKSFQKVTAKEQQITSCNLKKGDILFTPSSETPNDIGHSVVISENLENTVFSYHLMRFRPKIEIDILYSHYFCNVPIVLSQLSKFATGSTRFTISVKSFSDVEISLPSLLEQKVIGKFLSLVENKIDTEKQILEKLELQKKFFLSNLFV